MTNRLVLRRFSRGTAACCGLLLAGCAQQTRSLSQTPPSTDELPHFQHTERILPVSVGVEGRSSQPREVIVPLYRKPDLTAEEKKALGIHEPHYEFISLYPPAFDDRPVGGLVRTSVGIGLNSYIASALSPAWPSGGIGGRAYRAVGIGNEPSVSAAAGGVAAERVGKGSKAAVVVGEGDESHIAGRARHAEP